MPLSIPWDSFNGGGGSSCVTGSGPSLAKSSDMDCLNGITTVTLTVTNGVAPYTWSTTKGVITGSGASVTLTPPVNTGAGVVGTAFGIVAKYVQTFGDCVCTDYDCAGNVKGVNCSGIGCLDCWQAVYPGSFCNCTGPSSCADAFFCVANPSCGLPGGNFANACTGLQSFHVTCDKRSGSMISAGCNPCELSMAGGAVVSVTDAEGLTAFISVNLL